MLADAPAPIAIAAVSLALDELLSLLRGLLDRPAVSILGPLTLTSLAGDGRIDDCPRLAVVIDCLLRVWK